MAPKTRKSLSPWYTCEVCNVVLTQKDLPLHQDKCCPPPVEDWSHGFIRDKVLHSSLELFTATDSVKYLPKSEYDHLVFLSISAMQLCAMVIGDPVVVTVGNKSVVKAAWPTAERSLVSVQMTRGALDLEWGSCEGLVTVGCLTRPVWPAREISVGATGSVDVPANISSLLHRKYKGKLLCEGNRVCIPHYGRTLCFRVETLAALDAPNGVDALSKHLSDISLTETVAEQRSTTPLRNSGLGSGRGDTMVSERSSFCKIVECTKWNVIDAGKVDDKESRPRLCDVGGLESVIAQVKELMDLALGTRKDRASLQGTCLLALLCQLVFVMYHILEENTIIAFSGT
uniref:(California timema) hypothetical protein n=1 Tax=Timema californicum TaxID=61474 RepID=A0A7R9JIA2_TIMCA|nr:unnamed protein product [Timema californicum]